MLMLVNIFLKSQRAVLVIKQPTSMDSPSVGCHSDFKITEKHYNSV